MLSALALCGCAPDERPAPRAVRCSREDRSIAHGEDGRGVNDDHVELLAELGQQLSTFWSRKKFARVGCSGPRRKNLQTRAPRHEGVLKQGLSCHHIAQTHGAVDAQQAGHTWPPKVAFDEADAQR